MAMTITATMSGATANQHIYLQIDVLTGATEAGGAPLNSIGASGGASAGGSLTPNFSNSLVCFAISADNPGNAAFTALTNNSLNSPGLDSDDWLFGQGHFTGTVTAGTPVAFGGNCISSDYTTWAGYEIRSSGGSTPVLDASAPVLASATGAGIKTVTSASFTPPPGSVLVAKIVAGGTGSSGSLAMAVSGGSLTWTQRAGNPTVTDQSTYVFTATVPSGAAPAALRQGPGIAQRRRPSRARLGQRGTAGGGQPGGSNASAAAAAAPKRRPALPSRLPARAAAGSGHLAGAGQPGGSNALPVAVAAPKRRPALPSRPASRARLGDSATAGDGQPGGANSTVVAPPYITGLAGAGAGYFADQHGKPRMVLGDAVWGLPGNAGRWNSGNWQADYDGYFATRAAQGFTAAYTKPMGTTQNGGINDDGRTFDGLFPFQGGSLANPSTGLTSAFWARIDYMLASAAAQGITIFLNAIGYNSDFQVSGPLFGKSATEFGAYGTALGNRYKSTPNLIWMVADDYFGGSDTEISAFLTALRAAGDTHPITIENYPETTSREDLPGGTAPAWGLANGQFNFCYSYNVTYFGIEKAYLESSPITVIQGDGYFYQGSSSYEGGTGAFAFDRAIRQDAWHAISSAGRGIIHGDEACWQWQSNALADSATGWYYANNAGHIRTLMESLPNWQLLVPDTSSALVTSGRGTHATSFSSGGGGGQYEVAFTDSYVTASRAADGSLAVIYLSHATTITVDQTKMASGYQAFWVDPVSGAKTSTTAGSSYNSATPGSNSQGDPDWVLVLQAPAATTAAAQGRRAAPPRPPRRALTGSRGQPGSGAAGPQPPAAAASPVLLRPPASRSRPPRRARLRKHGLAWAGHASQVSTPLGSLLPPRPFVARSPAPRRAWIGSGQQSESGGGIASQVTTPLGTPPAPRRPQLGPYRHTRAVTGPRRDGSGLAAGPNTAPGAGAYQRPGPSIRRPAPARAVTGPRGAPGGGIASRAVAQLGSLAAPRKVPLYPPRFTRAVTGPRATGGGIAAGPNTAPGAGSYQRAQPAVRRPAPARALTGPHGAAGSGQQGTPNAVLPVAARPSRPVVSRAVPRRAVWHGAAGANAAPAASAYRRPPATRPSPPQRRAVWQGVTGANAAPGVSAHQVAPSWTFGQRRPQRAVWHRGIGLVNKAHQAYQVPPLPKPIPPRRAFWGGAQQVGGIRSPISPAIGRPTVTGASHGSGVGSYVTSTPTVSQG